VRIKLYFVFLLFLCTVWNVSAQNAPDSLKKRIYFSGFSSLNAYQDSLARYEDSLLKESFFYDKLKWYDVFIPRTGNPGSAAFELFENSRMLKFVNDGFSQFDNYLWNPVGTKHSASKRRFTNIDYHLGSKKEQHIILTHEQKIKPWFVAGIDFAALKSPGDFSQQLNSNRSFDVYLKYEAPSRVYRGFISYTANRVLNDENGGIVNDSLFENASSLDTRTVGINLPGAVNKYRVRDYVLKQELNISRLFGSKDSSEKLKNFNEQSFVLGHSIWWNRKSVLFTSSTFDPDYFQNVYFDSSATYDSSFYNDVYQVVMLSWSTPLRGGEYSLKLGAGYEFQFTEYTTSGYVAEIDQGAMVLSALLSSADLTAGGGFTKSISGNFENIYRGNLNVDYSIGKMRKNKVFLNLDAAKMPQTMRDLVYVSNHFIWFNNFAPVETYNITAGFKYSKWNLDISVHSRILNDLVFYSEDYLPQVFSDYVSVNDLKITNSFRYGKFGWDNKIQLNQTSNDEVAPVPAIALFSSIYYHNRFFKRVLGFKAGIDVNYFSAYNGYGYMPASGIFYVQNEKEFGNYPQLGAFINLNIKSKARLFIRLDHFNAGLTERQYYGAYHYPLPGRTFKFGVSWDLVD